MISFIFSLLIAAPVIADTTVPSIVSISGYSNYTLDTTTTPPTLKIYAGYVEDAGSPACSTTAATETCDSCTGTGLVPCNKKMIYPSLKFHLELKTSGSLTGKTIKIKNSSGTIITTSFPNTSSSGSNYWIDEQWSTICNTASWGACDTNGSPFIFTFGYGANSGDSNLDEYLTVHIYFSYRNTASDLNYTDCVSTTATANQGFCGYTLERGDGKAYINTIYYPSTFPTSDASNINFSNVLFFYAPRAADGTDDLTVLSTITNASNYAEINVDTAKAPPIADNRLKDLTNGQYYCFVMASKDMTGNIYQFTPASSFPAAAVQNSTMCAKPAPVVGLLDDKKCFIATAAFGSEIDPHVETFRQFRNKVLYKSKIGSQLVEFYYEKSPRYAAIIRESEFLRAVTRLLLWPLLGFAEMTLAIGLSPTFVVLFLFFGILLYRRNRWPQYLVNLRRDK